MVHLKRDFLHRALEILMKHTWFWALFLLLVLAACGGSPLPTPAPTAPAADNGYPPPAAPTSMPQGYPAQRPTPTLPTGYPDDTRTWLIKPVGMQCQENIANLNQEVAALQSAGIPVLAAQMTTLAVCEACDVCATSEHYRVLVPPEQIEAAKDLGWTEEPE